MEWAYGITTVPNRCQTLLPRTLESLANAGFDRPILFVDGMDENWVPPSKIGGLVMHHPKVGHIPNWALALSHLYHTKPHAQRYAIFEDDLLATKGLRIYLDRWYPERGFLNLITHPENLVLTQGIEGWHESNQKGRGAVGLVFNRECARSILSSHIFLDHTHHQRPEAADYLVIESLNVLGYKEYIHCPTLIQHIGGGQSVLGHQYGEMPGWRGEDFDLTQLDHNKKGNIPVYDQPEAPGGFGVANVIIPTRKPHSELQLLIHQIKETAGMPCEVYVTGIKDGSASENRNKGLEWAKGCDWVCMIDDDCQPQQVGWLSVLARAMFCDDVVFASSALYQLSGMPAYMTGLNDCGGCHKASGVWECPSKRVLTACCAFKPNGIKFDETYTGSGFEDTDYCNQLSEKTPAGKFIVCFDSKVIHINEMKEQKNNWSWNKMVYHSKWVKQFKPMIALYKTYRGGEWFEASLESIRGCVQGIVVVSSSKPWSNEIDPLPENCLEPLHRFQLKHPDVKIEVVHMDDDGNQGNQYRAGLQTISNKFGDDVCVLVIDTDEIWEEKQLNILKTAMTADYNSVYFKCRLHNYIKHPYWRITPQEPHRPTVGLQSPKAPYIKGRFDGLGGDQCCVINVSYHHFPLVRLDEKEIFHKLRNTASQDGPCLPAWMENVWNKLPEGKNIHPAMGYQACWGGVEVVDIKSLPIHARNSIIVNKLLTTTPDNGDNMVPTVVMERHIAGFHKRMDEWPELFDLEFWRKQESYTLIKEHCTKKDVILEVGCLNGHHCLLLAQDGYTDVTGIEFNGECIKMAEDKKKELGLEITPDFLYGEFPEVTISSKADKIILFDVIEHMTNLQATFEECAKLIADNGEVLVLVPKGKHYYDSGHINFWPDEETLTNHLEVYFNVVECKSVEEDKKMFARCTSKELNYDEAMQDSRVGCNVAV